MTLPRPQDPEILYAAMMQAQALREGHKPLHKVAPKKPRPDVTEARAITFCEIWDKSPFGVTDVQKALKITYSGARRVTMLLHERGEILLLGQTGQGGGRIYQFPETQARP